MKRSQVGPILQDIFETHSRGVPADLQDVFRRLDAVPGTNRRRPLTGPELLGRALHPARPKMAHAPTEGEAEPRRYPAAQR